MSKFKNGLKLVGMSLLVIGATVLVNPNKANAECSPFDWICASAPTVEAKGKVRSNGNNNSKPSPSQNNNNCDFWCMLGRGSDAKTAGDTAVDIFGQPNSSSSSSSSSSQQPIFNDPKGNTIRTGAPDIFSQPQGGNIFDNSPKFDFNPTPSSGRSFGSSPYVDFNPNNNSSMDSNNSNSGPKINFNGNSNNDVMQHQNICKMFNNC